jgi:hypothetical protein
MPKMGLRKVRRQPGSLLKSVNSRYPGKKNITTKTKMARTALSG